MKMFAVLFAFFLALPMVDEASAADRGGGSSRDSGGRGGFSRDASPSRSFNGRQVHAAPSGVSSSREGRTSERGTTSRSRDRIDTGGRRASEMRQPGGMTSGTAFPSTDPHPRTAIPERRSTDRSRGSDMRRFDNGAAKTQRLDASRQDARGLPSIRSSRANETRSGENDQRIRIDRRGPDDHIRGRSGSGGDRDRARGAREGERREHAERDHDRRENDRHVESRDRHADARDGPKIDRRNDTVHRDHRVDRRHTASRSHWHGDIRHFKRHDFDKWRRGSWHHGHHHGRIGWWWVVGPSWYFYSGPVYPYPNPYVPPVVVVSQTTIDDTRYWYYCEEADDYYPYVEECTGEWIPIPAEPEAAMPPRY